MTASKEAPHHRPMIPGTDPRRRGLWLSVRGGQHDGRRIRLVGAKCTVGSAPSCSLRLEAPGVHPVHCLIIRGSRGTVIRCWSGDTRLNGREFDDSWLQPGDRLSVGQIELEVLSDRLPDEDLPVPADPAAGTVAGGDTLRAAAPAGDGQTDPSAEESTSNLRQQLAERLQHLLEHQRLLTEREEQLALQQSEFAAERKQWSHEREAELAELNAREECLCALRDEIELERQAYLSDKQACEPRESGAEAQAKQVKRLQTELEEVRQQRDELEAMIEQLRRDRDDTSDAPSWQQSPQQESLSAYDLDRRRSGAAPMSLADSAGDTEFDPVAAAEVDSAADSDLGATDAQEPWRPAVEKTVREEDEFSIEEYMSQLIRRVGGGQGQLEADADPSPIGSDSPRPATEAGPSAGARIAC